MGIFNLRAMREYKEDRNNMKPLWSVVKAAGLLGISPWTVRSYVRQGKLRPVRIGRRVLLQEEELQQFVALSTAQPITSEGLEEATPSAQMEEYTND